MATRQAAGAAGFKSRVKMGLWRLSPGLLDRVQKKPEQEFSIAIYTGASVESLAPAEGMAQPVLTKSDVSDIPATFVADPFIHQADGRWHMFFEVMHGAYRRGVISAASSDDGLAWRYDRVVLAEDYHLSYPYVFEHDGEHYMIPETGRAGAVRLYRAGRFPYDWRVVATLVDDAHCVDSSISCIGGVWWLWTAARSEGTSRDLRLYLADSPLGPWREHPMSPVVRGESGLARPAGRIFVDSGRIMRFAQSAYPDYGTRVYLLEVTELSPTRYAETLVPGELLGPGSFDWNRDGMHHIDLKRLPDGQLLASVDGWRKHAR